MDITPSQQKVVDRYANADILIKHAITKGGWLYVEYKRRHSDNFPTAQAFYGRRGGLLEEYLVHHDGRKILAYARD